MLVLLDGAKSAEPPIRLGMRFLIMLRIVPLELLVASAFSGFARYSSELNRSDISHPL